MKRTKKYKNLKRRKGELEFRKLISYLILVVVLILILFFIWKNWPIVKGAFEKISSATVNLVEGVSKTINPSTFGLRTPESQREVLNKVLATHGVCIAGDRKKNADFIKEYKKAISSIESNKKNLDLKEEFEKRLTNCHKVQGDIKEISRNIAKVQSGKAADKVKAVQDLIELAKNNIEEVTLKSIEEAEKLLEKGIEKDRKKELLGKLKEIKRIVAKYTKNKKGYNTFISEYQLASTENDKKIAFEKVKKLFGELPEDFRVELKDIKANIDFQIAKNGNKKDCSRFDLLKKDTGLFLLDKNAKKTSIPLNIQILVEEAECYQDNTNNQLYYEKTEEILKNSKLPKITKESITKQFQAKCISGSSKGIKKFDACNEVNKEFDKGEFRCYWINTDDFIFKEDVGQCGSCLNVLEERRKQGCGAYNKKFANPKDVDDIFADWDDQCRNDPCGFSPSGKGCFKSRDECKDKNTLPQEAPSVNVPDYRGRAGR